MTTATPELNSPCDVQRSALALAPCSPAWKTMTHAQWQDFIALAAKAERTASEANRLSFYNDVLKPSYD